MELFSSGEKEKKKKHGVDVLSSPVLGQGAWPVPAGAAARCPARGSPGWLSTAGVSPPRRLPCGTELSPAASQKPFPGLHGVTSPS